MLATIALVLVPWISWWFPSEMANWYLASALVHEQAGAADLAERAFSTAHDWDPDNLRILDARARFRSGHGNLQGALQDLQILVDSESTSRDAMRFRSEVWMQAGRVPLAIKDLTALDELAQKEVEIAELEGAPGAIRIAKRVRADILNQIAYFRALSRYDLPLAAKEIDLAFVLMGGDEPSAHLDTRGYIHYLLGHHADALQDLEKAANLMREETVITENRIRWLRTGEIDPQSLDRQGLAYRQGLAVVYRHLAQVRQELGQQHQAQDDFEYSDHLGYVPEFGRM